MKAVWLCWSTATAITMVMLLESPIPPTPVKPERVAVRRLTTNPPVFDKQKSQLVVNPQRLKPIGPKPVQVPPVSILSALRKGAPRWESRLPLGWMAVAAAAIAPPTRARLAARTSVLPSEEIEIIARDAAHVGPGYRWLTMGHIPPADLPDTITAVNYALQSVSRVRAITPAVQISPTVLRIDVSAYVNDAKEQQQWENEWAHLAAVDFYHHLTTQVSVNGKIETVTVAGGWCGLDREAYLRQVTGTPKFGAVLRADYFVASALKAPAYYAFSGSANTLAEWLKQFGVTDLNLVEKLEANVGANLFISGITLKDRRVVWLQSLLGGVYATFDSKKSDAAHDPFYRPISADGSEVKYDAQELFARKRNGFWDTYIADNKGKRLDVVDPQIVSHDYAVAALGASDTQIYAGRNCLLCHTANGLNAFTDDQSRLLKTTKGLASLSSYNGSYVRRVLGFYDAERMELEMKLDRYQHAKAVMRACGTTPEKAVAAVGQVIKRAEFDPVTPQTAADELQCSLDDLPYVIDGTHDANAAGLLEGHPINRDAWQSVYAELAVKRMNWKGRQ